MKIEKKVIIVDIDGTISDSDHRIHYIRTKPKNWKKFFEESKHDPVYQDVYWIINLLHLTGNTVLFVTARPESEREQTIQWLTKHELIQKSEKLYMRPNGDYRDDYIVKKDLLNEIREDGYDPFLALDDRETVVNMWREQGIYCFQVRGPVL